jgi:hypothetical protein
MEVSGLQALAALQLITSLCGSRAGLDGFREDKILFPTGIRTLDGAARR